MPLQTIHLKHEEGLAYGPLTRIHYCQFTPGATQAAVDATRDSHGVLAFTRSGVGVYVVELEGTPTDAYLTVNVESTNLNHQVRAVRVGELVTVSTFNSGAAADIAVLVSLQVTARQDW